MAADDILYYPRGSDELCREPVFGEGFIRWAYQDARVGPLGRLLFHTPWPSRLLGAWYRSRWSRRQIPGAIAQLHIRTAEFADPVAAFRSFNDFFIRRLRPDARPFSTDPRDVVSPADARVLVYPRLDGGTLLPVKGAPFTVAALLGRPAPQFDGGAALVCRLCPADYHRFHYPCAGIVTDAWDLPGRYHSVNPIAVARGLDIFPVNLRRVTLLDGRAGPVAYVEVGAFGVGSIIHTHAGGGFSKMTEKGYFQFGGSSLVLVFAPGRLNFAADLLAHSAAGYETLLKVGDTVATVTGAHPGRNGV